MEVPDRPPEFASGPGPSYPPKPVITPRGNTVRRSLIALVIYGVLFYFIFERNLPYVAAVLIVLLIHELGHFVLMRLFSYSNVKIFILPLLGAYTGGHKQKVSQRELSLIILGGPVPGIIIGCVLLLLNRKAPGVTLAMLANAFLIINLLNCLPFYPLDGGRLLETLFFRENHLIRLVFGVISVMVLTVLFLLMFNPLLLLFPLMIGWGLVNERKHQKIRDYLRLEGVNYRVDYENLPDKDYWIIRDCLLLSFPRKFAGVTPGKNEYSLLEPAIATQVGAVLQTDLRPDVGTVGKLAFILIYLLLFAIPLGIYFFGR